MIVIPAGAQRHTGVGGRRRKEVVEHPKLHLARGQGNNKKLGHRAHAFQSTSLTTSHKNNVTHNVTQKTTSLTKSHKNNITHNVTQKTGAKRASGSLG